MEKSQKGTTPVNPKEKTSFLDEDIGKDFLSSWKSMAATEDDAMDFNFNMTSSGKNKAFNFEKLDMDFGLDGDFDKLSSFKVDMSDFDLSAPSKNAAKAKEISENQSSTGKPQGKKIPFNFSFDFNELDNFNFESSLMKDEKVSSKNKDVQMKISTDGTEKRSTNVQVSEDIGSFDDTKATKLLPASKDEPTSHIETLLSGSEHLNTIKQDCGKYLTSEPPISSRNFRSSSAEETTNSVEAIDQQSHLSEKADDFLDHSRTGVDSSRSSISKGQTKATYLGEGVNSTSSPNEDINGKIIGVSSFNETLPLKNTSPPDIISSRSNSDEKNSSGSDISMETMDDNDSAMCDLELAENSNGSLSSNASHDIQENKENQNLVTELPIDLSSEETRRGIITNGKEDSALHLMFPKRDGNALGTGSLSSETKRTSPMHKSTNTEIEMSLTSDDGRPRISSVGNPDDDEQHGISPAGNPVPASREMMKGEDALRVVANNANDSSNIRMGLSSDDGQPGINFGGKFVPAARELMKGEDALLIDAKNVKPPSNIRMALISDDGQTGINSDGNPVPADRELTKGDDALLVGAKNVKHTSKSCNFQDKEDFTFDGLSKLCKLVGNSQVHGAEVKNRKPVMSTSENAVKVQNSKGMKGSSSLMTFSNPELLVSRLVSVRKPDIKSAEGKKLCLVRSPKKISDLSILNISKTKGADKVSESATQKDINSLQSIKQATEVQDNAASGTAYRHNSPKKKTPQNLSLKRKAAELPNSDLACLKPLKRISSPCENRRLMEPPRQIVDEKLSRGEKTLQSLSYLSKAPVGRDIKEPWKRVDVREPRAEEEKVCSHEEQEESNTKSNSKSILYNSPASKIQVPQEANAMGVELSSIIESDESMEKAEAYANDLENICNMLRKKHEEAKEILVRAVVNNNNLLMLNHPIYEHKICKVLKFAAGLMSKELKT